MSGVIVSGCDMLRVWQERDHMTGEVERLKREEAQAALEKKKAAEALMEEVHRSNAEQVSPFSIHVCLGLQTNHKQCHSVIQHCI